MKACPPSGAHRLCDPEPFCVYAVCGMLGQQTGNQGVIVSGLFRETGATIWPLLHPSTEAATDDDVVYVEFMPYPYTSPPRALTGSVRHLHLYRIWVSRDTDCIKRQPIGPDTAALFLLSLCDEQQRNPLWPPTTKEASAFLKEYRASDAFPASTADDRAADVTKARTENRSWRIQDSFAGTLPKGFYQQMFKCLDTRQALGPELVTRLEELHEAILATPKSGVEMHDKRMRSCKLYLWPRTSSTDAAARRMGGKHANRDLDQEQTSLLKRLFEVLFKFTGLQLDCDSDKLDVDCHCQYANSGTGPWHQDACSPVVAFLYMATSGQPTEFFAGLPGKDTTRMKPVARSGCI